MSSTITPAPWYDTLQMFKKGIFAGLRVSLPGHVAAVNADGTVDVTVDVMQNVAQQGLANGLDFKYPTLLACPTITVQGGGVGSVFPTAVGDECLVIFSDRCIDNWVKTGQATPLPSFRMHDINDGFVLVGLNSMAPASVLQTPLLPFEGGICQTKNPAGAKVVVNSATGKVSIKNGTKNLATILGTLVTTVTALNTTLAAMTTASIASGATQIVIATYTATFTTLISDLVALLY